MLTELEITTFKNKLATRLLEVSIKQAEAELDDDKDCALEYQCLFRFLSLYNNVILNESNNYTAEELEEFIEYIIFKGDLANVIPISFTNLTDIIVNIPDYNTLPQEVITSHTDLTDVKILLPTSTIVNVDDTTTAWHVSAKVAKDMLATLYQEEPPIYYNPSLILSSSINGYQKVGTNINPSLSATFNQNDAGNILSYLLKSGTTTLRSDATPPIDLSVLIDDIIVVEGNITYSATATYGEGIIKNSLPFNTPYPTGHITAGSINSGNVDIIGVMPWYYGISETDTTPSIYTDGHEVIAPSNGGLEVPSFGSGAKYLWFAVPRTSGDARVKLFTSWLRTVLNKGDIGGSTNLFRTPVIVSVTSTGLSTNWTRNYDLYFTNYATSADGAMTLS